MVRNFEALTAERSFVVSFLFRIIPNKSKKEFLQIAIFQKKHYKILSF